MCVHGRLWYKEFHVVTSCSTDQGGDQEWRRWNANQAIHNSVEHCSLGLLSPFLKGVPTKLVEHCCNAACPVIVSLYKAGRTSLDHLKHIVCYSAFFQELRICSPKFGNSKSVWANVTD